ncbi:Microsomal triglyceride transfer protein homolog [Caenorhabditis elegans]|uniref:Microsomal triglyceride transfer protein homolog n=1 Tax=Caenorhabditis elegans TaxID=6239 RepID=MTP_CAEEL|nr:Microsomal triglyceride transfer protein homolog [Caenorhabditis elegans]G5ECG7.1 RecName: Full=Microsomal triglyceride transfer protein homolog; AltName: Full=Defecation suppressor of clk-1; Flags: Precursor [Caenorhabditis elegans]AAR27937.1 microsomal triglyceride transfer protein [Caenorhabditis elegans]CCD69687.1 Microsomal triglyceride transfer protein homolog [Caenorhabditis elegans]|eukprot:NP_499903.3 Defecation Suppressor of Clk-1 [Caenorhabditis elegans]
MFSSRIWLLLAVTVGVCLAVPDLDEIKKNLRKHGPDYYKNQPKMNENTVRLLKVDYWFRTESMIYDDIDNKEKDPSTVIAGNFSFETLHHDVEGGMLGRFTLTQCNTDNCGNPSPIYIAFRQGGNNAEHILKASDESDATWNFLYAIVNTIYTPAEYGEGDEQTVDTIYGRCFVNFGRPEDKRFRRIIEKCDLGYGTNFTKFEGIESVQYDQDVWYTQNTKVDADIIMVDAIEMLAFKSPLHEKYGFTLESRTHVEITNRTRVFVTSYCNDTVPSAKCAEQAFGAVRVGGKLYEHVKIAQEQSNKLTKLIGTYRRHLQDMGDSHICEKHSLLYSQIAQEARLAKRQDWEAAIQYPENDHVLSLIASALGGVGTAESITTAREVLLTASPDYLDDLLFGISQSSSNNEKWHKQLMYWLGSLDKKSEEYWKVANTIATVLNKRCEASTSSLNSCNKGKETIVNKFITDLTAGGVEVRVLEVLENIPIFGSYTFAKKFICETESEDVQKAALNVILAASKNLYETQLTHKLIKLFRNTCSQETPTSHSQLAIDILLKCVPDHQNVATLILRTETLNPDDQEKWHYLYKAIEASGNKDELKAEFWSRMRKFKVFRPNFLHRALQADSHVHWQEIADASNFQLFSTANTEFLQKSFKRSIFELSMKKGRKEHNLFSLSIDTEHLEQFVTGSASSRSGAPQGSVRIGVAGHKLPTHHIFKGSTDLLSTVWEADGRTHKAFEGHVPVRDVRLSVPLLSGLTLDVDSVGAISMRVLASAEVSLWNQRSNAKAEAYTSGSLHLTASLYHHSEPVRHVESTISALSTFTTDTRAIFETLPYDFCLRTSNSNVDINQKTVVQDQIGKHKKKTLNRKRVHPGVTYRLDDSTIRQCNSYLEQFRL